MVRASATHAWNCPSVCVDIILRALVFQWLSTFNVHIPCPSHWQRHEHIAHCQITFLLTQNAHLIKIWVDRIYLNDYILFFKTVHSGCLNYLNPGYNSIVRSNMRNFLFGSTTKAGFQSKKVEKLLKPFSCVGRFR